MILALEQPHIRLIDRDGDAWCFPTYELPSAMAAWTAGQAFWSGVDLWGAAVTLRLGHIVAIRHMTTESLARLAEENDEETRRVMLKGE